MKTKIIEKQTKRFDSPDQLDGIPRPLVTWSRDFPSGHLIPSHSHPRAQLLYASSGVMTVTTEEGLWVVPTHRAVWIPARIRHQVRASGPLRMRTIYVSHEAVPNPDHRCRVVSVPPLLRELILAAMELDRLYDPEGPAGRIMAVILDQLQDLREAPLDLPLPRDERLAKVCAALRKNPGRNRTLAEWGRVAGACERTLARLFKTETGMTFGQWRQQVRILEALRRLGHGDQVTTIALELGYDSPSAFIAMFRKTLGTTPGRYFRG